MTKTKFRVAICGGGIGGLTLAAVLGKFSHDIEVDIYEAATEFSEIGAGISIWRRTWRIMEIIGLDEGLKRIAIQPPTNTKKPGFTYRKSDKPGDSYNFHEMMVSYGPITVHRAEFLKVLTDGIPSKATTHFSKRMTSYTENDSGIITLNFSDGTQTETDILIGCDGIKSATRRTMYQSAARKEDLDKRTALLKFVEPTWSGTLAYRTLVETKKLTDAFPGHRAATTPLMYCGKNKHIVSYPISKGRLINLIGFVTVLEGEGTIYEGPAVRPVTKEEMVGHFRGWETEAESLMDFTENPSLWAISAVRGLPFYVRGRVALLGDSCHAMTTHLGAGAGQAIEDAHILGRILSDPRVTLDNVGAALRVYDSIRRPLGSGVVEKSRMTGFMYEFNSPGYEDSKNLTEDDLKILGEQIYHQWCWQWETLPDDDWILIELGLDDLQVYGQIPSYLSAPHKSGLR